MQTNITTGFSPLTQLFYVVVLCSLFYVLKSGNADAEDRTYVPCTLSARSTA